MCNKIK